MAHSEPPMSGSRRFTIAKPCSPLPTSGGRGSGGAGAGDGEAAVERFLPLGSSLPPYHPGSIIAANNNNNNNGSAIKSSNPVPKSYACRKIRNDISDEERQEIFMAFALFDSRKSGKLNATELKVAMRALDFHVKKADVRKIIQEHTKGRGDEIDQEDFIEILTKKYKEKDPEEDLLKAFKYFDEDNTGKISLKNLRKIAKDLGEHITDEELAAMIDEFDKDGDGETLRIGKHTGEMPSLLSNNSITQQNASMVDQCLLMRTLQHDMGVVLASMILLLGRTWREKMHPILVESCAL